MRYTRYAKIIGNVIGDIKLERKKQSELSIQCVVNDKIVYKRYIVINLKHKEKSII